MKQIEIKITKDGSKVEMDTKGFQGVTCSDFMGAISKALGTQEAIKKKSEYYQQSNTNLQTR